MKDLTDKLRPFLEKYWIGEADIDPSNRDFFSAIVKIAINEYGMYHSEIAEDLKVEHTTVDEWIEGRTFPPQEKRNEVFQYFAQRI